MSKLPQFRIASRLTSSETDSFRIFMGDIANSIIMTKKEEKKWLLKAELGDKNAIDKIINANLRFVITVAKQYVDKDCKIEDAIQAGNLGLTYAAMHFNTNYDNKFISFAVGHIRAEIIKYKNTYCKLIRLSHGKNVQSVKIKKLINKFILENGREPDISELNLVELNIDDISFLDTQNVTSLDHEIDEDNNTLKDYIPDTTFDEPDNTKEIDTVVQKEKVRKMLTPLTKKERDVLVKHYGLEGNYAEMDLKEIAIELNISREAVRKIREKAILKIRKIYNCV